jgi:hypothetical protein
MAPTTTSSWNPDEKNEGKFKIQLYVAAFSGSALFSSAFTV